MKVANHFEPNPPRLATACHGALALTLLAVACSGDDAATTAGSTADASSAGSTADASSSAASTDPTAASTQGSASESASASGTAAPESTGPSTTAGTSTTDPTTTDSTTTDSTTGSGDQVVRFVVLGDTGEGNEDQYTVAQAIVEICAQRGCDFAVLTGDNFYNSGVDGVDDPQWQTKFETPYEDFTFPVYAILGNHDYGGSGTGIDVDGHKPDYQVQYTQKSKLWKMPARYYAFALGDAEFWALDTNEVMTDPINGSSDPQKAWFQAGTAASAATWKIVFGHHPYISNGPHGNAGDYENLEAIPFPFIAGTNVKKFMDATICNKIDVYFSGHDHQLQWLQPTCGVEFIVSGAGSKAGPLPGKNPFRFQLAEMEGFIWVEIIGKDFTGVFYDKTGAELFTHALSK